MKRKRATEEHHRLDNMSFLGLWRRRRRDNKVKQHSITMIVIPEEFLPPSGRKEVICFFFSSSSIIASSSLLNDWINVLKFNIWYKEITQMSNKIQIIKFPQISNARIYKVIIHTVTTFLFSTEDLYTHRDTGPPVYMNQKFHFPLTCLWGDNCTASPYSVELKKTASTATLHIKSI